MSNWWGGPEGSLEQAEENLSPAKAASGERVVSVALLRL